MELKELVEVMVAALVDYADDILVQTTESEQTVLISLRVNEKDLGKVIGKRGRNVTALRTIASAVGAKHRKRVVLDVEE